jgi:hypothetical protein
MAVVPRARKLNAITFTQNGGPGHEREVRFFRPARRCGLLARFVLFVWFRRPPCPLWTIESATWTSLEHRMIIMPLTCASVCQDP